MTEPTFNGEMMRVRRRRAMMLRFIRDGHESQMSRMDDFDVYALMQDMGITMSRNQVMTMLQDLQTLGLVSFETVWNEVNERYVAQNLVLTAIGLGVVMRRKNTDEVLFD